MDFLPASATSAKAKKHALKQAAAPHKTSSSKNSNKKSNKGKSTPMFLSTQPAASAEDDAMTDAFERLPMDSRTDAQKAAAATSGNKVAAGDADAAMAVDDDADDEDDDAVMINPSDLSVPEPVVRTKLADIAGADALSFPAVSHVSTSGLTQRRKVGIPQHRMTPLKRDWIKVRCCSVMMLWVKLRKALICWWVVWRRSTARWWRSAACRFG